MRKVLSEKVIRAARPPAQGKRFEIVDARCPGLVLRVTDKGAKSFCVIYRAPASRRQVRYTLGPWPEMDLAIARQRALALRTEVTVHGRDPRAEEKARKLHTFGAVAESFMELVAMKTIDSWKNIRGSLDRHLLPAWGDHPIGEIRRRDVHALIDGIVKKGKLGAAREARKHTSRIFGWAFDRELVETNPAYHLRRDDLRQREAGRALADDELRAVWLAAGGMGYPWAQVFRLIILTGARRSEIALTRRSEIDRQRRILVVSRERQKSDRDHLIPLAPAAWALVEGCPRFVGKDVPPDPFVFSFTSGKVPVGGFVKAKERLDEEAAKVLGRPVDAYRVHDLRVTCRTRLASLGVPREVAEAVIGHKKPGLVAVYDKHDFLDERRAALVRYAEHVQQVVGDTGWRAQGVERI
jgi:integrase